MNIRFRRWRPKSGEKEPALTAAQQAAIDAQILEHARRVHKDLARLGLLGPDQVEGDDDALRDRGVNGRTACGAGDDAGSNNGGAAARGVRGAGRLHINPRGSGLLVGQRERERERSPMSKAATWASSNDSPPALMAGRPLSLKALKREAKRQRRLRNRRSSRARDFRSQQAARVGVDTEGVSP